MTKIDLNILFRVIRRYAKKDPWMFFDTIFYNMLAVMRPFLSVILVSLLLDQITAGYSAQELISTAVIGSTVIFLLTQLENYLMKKRSEQALRTWDLQKEYLSEKNLRMEYDLFEDSDTQLLMRKQLEYAKMSQIVFTNIFEYTEQLSRILTGLVMSVILAVPLFLSCGFIGAAVPLLLLAAVTLLHKKEGEHRNRMEHDCMEKWMKDENLVSYYLNTLLGNCENCKDIHIFHQKPLIQRELDGGIRRMEKHSSHMFQISLRHGCTAESASSLTGWLLYLFAGLISLGGQVTLGNAVKYVNGITSFMQSFSGLTMLYVNIRQLIPYAREFEEFLTLEKDRFSGSLPIEKRRDNKFSLEFKNVSFRYPNADEYALKNITFKLEIGDRIAIVGRNGSGKTTFIKLLCRLYDPTEGEILVNGIDIRKYNEQEYRRILAVVFQDYHIFSLKVSENVAASQYVDSKRVLDAMKKAGLEPLLQKLPSGIDTYIGKEFDANGFKTSGGENQKLAIARAIYHRAPFVIMDEPTAALDPVAEYEVYSGFDRLVGTRTAFYVSHRLSSCRFCNEILVFDEGHIVQRGNHDTLLLQKDGLYAQLWNAQAQYYA